MRRLTRIVGTMGMVATCIAVAALTSFGQQKTPTQAVEIPVGATSLEGTPTVRIDAAETGATRHVLAPSEAASQRLKINVIDGKLYWASRGNRPLALNTSGDFTYLASTPGEYIRLTRINDRISYIEHVDLASENTPPESITWWGELRILVGH